MDEEILIPITFFASVAFILYYYFRYRYLERQAIIDKGMNIDELKTFLKKTPRQNGNSGASSAKWGIILIAIGLAILIGSQFSDEIMVGLIFMLPGFGLLLYYKFIYKQVNTE